VHHNPLRHGYVARWTDWPWSSATEYLVQTDAEEAMRIWHEYPLRGYGKDWDEPEM
jgi:putative transposase